MVSVNDCVEYYSPTGDAGEDYVLKQGDVVKMYVLHGINWNYLLFVFGRCQLQDETFQHANTFVLFWNL